MHKEVKAELKLSYFFKTIISLVHCAFGNVCVVAIQPDPCLNQGSLSGQCLVLPCKAFMPKIPFKYQLAKDGLLLRGGYSDKKAMLSTMIP